MDSETAGLLPSSQRAIPLVTRRDLVAKRIAYQGIDHWVVKDPLGLKYHRLRAEQFQLLLALDGKRGLEELRELILADFPTLHLQLTDLQQLVVDLYEKGLVRSDRPGQGFSLVQRHDESTRKKLFATVRNMLYVKLPGWDPYDTLNRYHGLVRWMFHPTAVAFTALLVGAAWLLLLVQFGEFRNRLPEFQQFFGWPNLMYLWMVLAATKVLHEFGHAFSCKHFGGECHEIGVLFLVFSPTMYCEVSDSWMMRNKWHRIAIAAAGMYVETILSGIAIFVWWFTQPGLLHHLCLNVFFITTVTTVVFNANPLMRFDGYYMLADYLEIPNLRPKADKLLRETFSWYCLGIPSKRDPFMPETGRVWFVGYAIAAWLYRWFILFGITLFLYTVLKPYGLQSIGITLAVVSIATIVFNMVYQVYSIITAPRVEPMSRVKITATLSVLAVLIAAAAFIPIPLHVEASFTIEPHAVRDVYTTVPGEIRDVRVEPGEAVQRGQVLAQLTNPDKQEEYLKLVTQLRAQQAEISTQHALENWSQHELAVRQLRTIKEELADYEEQLERLTIRAPCDGLVVAAPLVERPDIEQRQQQLGGWFGTPLDEKNRDAFLAESTHLASIAPDDHFDAVLLVDQADRRDVAIGQQVEIKLEHLPDKTYTAEVEEISKRHLEFAPDVLSNKYGGDLSTVTDPSGHERLASVAYQVKVRLEKDTPLLMPGMRGRARFLVDSRTAADWGWRYFRQTFHFRL